MLCWFWLFILDDYENWSNRSDDEWNHKSCFVLCFCFFALHVQFPHFWLRFEWLNPKWMCLNLSSDAAQSKKLWNCSINVRKYSVDFVWGQICAATFCHFALMRTDAEDYTAVSEQWLLLGLTATLVGTRIFCKPLRSNFFQTRLHKKWIWWIQVTCCLAGNPVIKHMPIKLHLNSIWWCLYSNRRTGMRTQHYNKMPPSTTICFSVVSFRAISCQVSTDSLWRPVSYWMKGPPTYTHAQLLLLRILPGV